MSVWRMETSDDPGSKSCRVIMTVLLSFEEKTDNARTCAQSGHSPFKFPYF